MAELVLVFDNTKAVKRKTGSKVTYALRTEEDVPIKVRLTIECKEKALLEEIIKEKFDLPVIMELTNVEPEKQ